MASAAEKLGENLLSTIAVIVGLGIVCFVPQIHNLLCQLPTWVGPGEWHYVAEWYLFCGALIVVYLYLAKIVVATSPWRSGEHRSLRGWRISFFSLAGVWFIFRWAALEDDRFGVEPFILGVERFLPPDMFFLGCAVLCIPRPMEIKEWHGSSPRRKLWEGFGRFLVSIPLLGLLFRRWWDLTRVVRAFWTLGLSYLVLSGVGALVWWLADVAPEYVSLRAYMVWAVFHILVTLIMVARIVDFLHVKFHESWPVRPVALLVILVLIAFLRPVEVGHSHRKTDAEPRDEILAARAEKWFDTLEARLEAVDETGGPAVVVAASGGGSRAALFTALVFHFLEDYRVGRSSLADRLVLFSGVSGGSLGGAYYVHRQFGADSPKPELERWNNSIPGELFRRMKRRAAQRLKALEETAKTEEWKELPYFEVLGSIVEKEPLGILDEKLQRSRYVDDMGGFFMAPLLSGILNPLAERGHKVSHYWESSFGWQGTDNLSGFGARREGGATAPVALFNATNVDSGQGFVISFPGLPPGLIDEDSSLKTLMNVDPHHQVSLAEAVRLSANFPWGFRTPYLDLPEGKAGPDGFNLTDGGVVDNTGLNSVYELFRALRGHAIGGDAIVAGDRQGRKAYYDVLSRRSEAILRRLERTGLFFIVIDSGTRPSNKSFLGRLFPEVFDPTRALSNSYSENAKARVHKFVEQTMRLFKPDPEAGKTFSIPLDYQIFTCNKFGKDVMTAWSLGPEDKARIFLSYLVETENVQRQLDRKFLVRLVQRIPHLTERASSLLEPLAKRLKAEDAVGGIKRFIDRRAKRFVREGSMKLETEMLQQQSLNEKLFRGLPPEDLAAPVKAMPRLRGPAQAPAAPAGATKKRG